MLRKIISGFLAGVLVSIGGTVYLSCENKSVGAVLFSVALLCICKKGYSLYTGKIGFIPERHGREDVSVLLFGLLGNILATLLCGFALRYALPAVYENAPLICAAKLSQSAGSTLIRAAFCGILMYLAVCIYRDRENIVGILFCIPVFILSGYEHSVANLFYFAAGGFSWSAVLYIAIVFVGNTCGSMLFAILESVGKDKTENGKES